jgi:hypothetical protein
MPVPPSILSHVSLVLYTLCVLYCVLLLANFVCTIFQCLYWEFNLTTLYFISTPLFSFLFSFLFL